MKNSTINKRGNASRFGNAWSFGARNPFRIILGSALLLVTSFAVAGILFVPLGGQYDSPELAPVDIQIVGDGILRVRTDGLSGELSLDASDMPPEFDPPASGCKRFPFDRDLELYINSSLGVVDGHTSGQIVTENGTLEYRGVVKGHAICMPAGGDSCGQLMVNLESNIAVRGEVGTGDNILIGGFMSMQTLGSLVRDAAGASWTSLASNARLGGKAGTIDSLTSMTEGESCGI